MPCPVLLLIGPSGSGKTAAVTELVRRNLIAVTPTWTTRPRRPDEAGGCANHHFVTEDEFSARAAEGFFLGTMRLFGLEHRYGLPHVRLADDGRVPTVVARAAVVPLIAAHVPEYVVWQIEAPRPRIDAAVRARGSRPIEVSGRLAHADDEVAAGRALADGVFVNDGALSALVDAMAAALPAIRSVEVAA
jgi:guanylate kinase